MSDLPSIWTLMPGVLIGMLFLGRIARWLQFVLSVMGKPTGSFDVNSTPRPWKTLAAVILYPTPWIALTLVMLAIQHIAVAPFTAEWRWFYIGFFGGPVIAYVWLYRKMRKLKGKKQLPQPG